MSPADINPVQAAELVRRSLLIADRAVVADITDACLSQRMTDATWWDVRPMLDPREHSMECVDMATEALDYAQMRGLVARHPELKHLVRITRQP